MDRSLEDTIASPWWIRAAGRVWGPYGPDRLPQFCAEGRLSARTLVSRSREGPFSAAVEHPPLAALLGVRPSPPTDDAAPAALAERGPRLAAPAGRSASGARRPLLVVADLGGPSTEAFEAALAAHGPFERVAGSLWLVQSDLPAAGLRNALSRRLSPADRLLVAESTLDQAAWFNLEPEQDRRLRTLWALESAISPRGHERSQRGFKPAL
jgi:hypothetical protein